MHFLCRHIPIRWSSCPSSYLGDGECDDACNFEGCDQLISPSENKVLKLHKAGRGLGWLGWWRLRRSRSSGEHLNSEFSTLNEMLSVIEVPPVSVRLFPIPMIYWLNNTLRKRTLHIASKLYFRFLMVTSANNKPGSSPLRWRYWRYPSDRSGENTYISTVKADKRNPVFFFTFEIRYEKNAPKNFRRFAAKKDPRFFSPLRGDLNKKS